MPDELRELREELADFKLDVVQRLTRIETKMEGGSPSQAAGQATEGPSVQALGKVSVGLVEWGKLALQIVAAVVAALLAVNVRGGGTP